MADLFNPKQEERDPTFAYREIFEGATAWANGGGPESGTVTVTRQGLRNLLQIARDAWPFVMTVMRNRAELSASAKAGKFPGPDATADMLNQLSEVWCEGGLIVSRLFVGPDGKPIVNVNAEANA